MTNHAAQQYTKQGRLSTTLELASRSTPSIKPNQALVKVKAVSLNPVDGQLAQLTPQLLRLVGLTPPTAETPWVPGCDFAGVIAKAGPESGWKEGEEVFGVALAPTTKGSGTLQEYLAIDPSWPMTRKPPSLSFAEAAALPLVYSTVHDALIKHGRLPFDPSEGEVGKRTLLVLGGSSGTGSVAVHLAKKMGLKVVATCSTRNVEFVKALGADEVIDYTKSSVVDMALFSQYAPFAVVLDCVGGKDVVRHIDNLVLHDASQPQLGVYVTIVGDKTSRDAMGGSMTNYLYPAQAWRTFRGSLRDTLPSWTPFKSLFAGTRYICMSLEPSKAILDSIPDFVAAIDKVIIDSTWSFSDARKAYARLETGRAVGKVVVEIE